MENKYKKDKKGVLEKQKPERFMSALALACLLIPAATVLVAATVFLFQKIFDG
ncbi:MAG: hypothetical protein WC618_00550 [Patescibacteria group bacterium]